MTSAESLFPSASLAELSVRTEYEAWFLEAVYEMGGLRIAAGDPELFSYPPNGSRPVCVKYAATDIRIGDWRGGFLKEGAPLVFMTAFKLLDMLIEWVLVQNGIISTHRFADKIRALAGPVQFPTRRRARGFERDYALCTHVWTHFAAPSSTIGVSRQQTVRWRYRAPGAKKSGLL